MIYEGSVNQGTNEIAVNLKNDLRQGVYFVEIKDDTKRYFTKILVSRP